MGFAQDVQDKFPEGLHTKVPVPVALSVVELPLQIETSAPAFTAGRGSVFTFTVAVEMQPLRFTASV